MYINHTGNLFFPHFPALNFLCSIFQSRIFQPCIFERVCAANFTLANFSPALSASPSSLHKKETLALFLFRCFNQNTVLKRTSIRRKNKIGATVCSFSHTLLMPTVDANDKACEFAILIQPYL